MITNYTDIRSQLKTGDIVLFSGKGPLSLGIRWATSSKWSHMGMVLNLEEFDFVCVWQSTTLDIAKDVFADKILNGVQLVTMSSLVNGYGGELAIRQLKEANLDKKDIKNLMNFRKEVSRRDYEWDVIELIKSAYDGLGGQNVEDLSNLFCSELVAEAYQRLGLLDEIKPSNEYTPADFSEKRGLELLKGFLGPEIKIL